MPHHRTGHWERVMVPEDWLMSLLCLFKTLSRDFLANKASRATEGASKSAYTSPGERHSKKVSPP